MSLFKNITLRKKLYVNITIVLILTGIVGWRGIVGMSDINEELNSIFIDQFVQTRVIANANISLIAWNRATLNHVLAENSAKMDEYEQIMIEQRISMTDRLKELSKMKNLSERGKQLIGKLQDDFKRADPIRDRIVALSREGKQEEARQLMRMKLRSIIDMMDKDMTEFLKLQEKQLQDAKEITDARYDQGVTRIFLVIGSALFFSFLIPFFLSNTILKNINELIRGMKYMSEGKFKQAKVKITSNDEFVYLGAGFNQMVEKTEQNIIEIKKNQRELRDYSQNLEETLNKLKDTQQQLMLKERLAVLGTFLGSISHELRNPLSVIDSSIYYLKMTFKDRDEKVQQHLERIDSSVYKSTKIIQSLLDLSRMKKPVMNRNNLVSIVSDSIISSKVPGKVKVIKDFPDDEVLVSVEEEQFRMALKNIIKNAVEAIDGKGTLSIVVQKTKKGQAEVSFADTGPGIDPENLKNIFQPLYSTKAKGFGFGLSLTEMIIENHNGMIRVESEPGKGTKFIISLPISEK